MQILRACCCCCFLPFFSIVFRIVMCVQCKKYTLSLYTFCYFDRSIHIDDVKNKIVRRTFITLVGRLFIFFFFSNQNHQMCLQSVRNAFLLSSGSHYIVLTNFNASQSFWNYSELCAEFNMCIRATKWITATKTSMATTKRKFYWKFTKEFVQLI